MYIFILDKMSKLISLSDDVYYSLVRVKGKHSFSQVIRNLMSSKKFDIMDFAGALAGDESLEELKKEITGRRKHSKARNIKAF
jgi:predicted CopG family antitoxin